MKRCAVLLFSLLSLGTSWATSTINTSHQYAWGANIGWLNWRPDFDSTNTEGVLVGEFVCSGYIYAANVGWINLGSGNPSDHIQYQNNSNTDFGVNVIMYDAEYQPAYESAHNLPALSPFHGIAYLRGYAYGANIGWINFESLGNPRIDLFTGRLSGYAYSANCGWINLDDMAGVNPNYVKTNDIQMGSDSNGNGVADAWEWLYFGRFLTSGEQTSFSPNGNGMTLLQDYRDGVNPFTANAGLKITFYDTTKPGGVTSTITFSSTTARLYSIDVNPDITLPLSWVDSGLGIFAPSDGTTTTRSDVIESSTAKRFFRVKTMRPGPYP